MELSEAYEDFEGEVRCWGCQAALEVVLHEGKLRSIRRMPESANRAVARRGETRAPGEHEER
jgi:16S rRNA U516 pseudouridylate synthase RsuA-like enzyme